ncbi:MAG TPA: GNAT family N-acetyltransferase [Anaerolineales bacterium]|nr:GNAT family N-acetyltransferase [Anaerolineales bacterium]
MKISVEELNQRNVKDVNVCDGEFVIDSRLVLSFENNELHYSIIQIPATRKRYHIDDIDYTTYIDNINRVAYLAYLEGLTVGQIILRKNWNSYAYIEDITVDVHFRKQGIGKELISWAKQWARDRSLRGIMLETQDNNVAACKFYESCGFQLGGFDTYLYKGIDPTTHEVALFWYFIYGEDSPHQSLRPDIL